jgi:hypothetical protein
MGAKKTKTFVENQRQVIYRKLASGACPKTFKMMATRPLLYKVKKAIPAKEVLYRATVSYRKCL